MPPPAAGSGCGCRWSPLPGGLLLLSLHNWAQMQKNLRRLHTEGKRPSFNPVSQTGCHTWTKPIQTTETNVKTNHWFCTAASVQTSGASLHSAATEERLCEKATKSLTIQHCQHVHMWNKHTWSSIQFKPRHQHGGSIPSFNPFISTQNRPEMIEISWTEDGCSTVQFWAEK